MHEAVGIGEERLDRQLRIAGWDQDALERALIGVVGDDDRLASLYVLPAAALGINQLVVIAPVLDDVLTGAAKRLNPRLKLAHLKGYYTYPFAGDLLGRCDLVVDLSRFALAGKLLLNQGFSRNIPVIRGLVFEEGPQRGLRVFCSGGTSVETGQVVVYDPQKKGPTPAQLLGLYDIVAARKDIDKPGPKASCSHQPDPSVIMTNQVVAGFMLDACRLLLDGQVPKNIFYDAVSTEKW